ncbi:MAG: phosphotransferase enzyme family protein, partial [Verrucomicrobiia bacterium]
MYNEEQLRHISKQFQIHGEIRHAELCKIGHINETYTATYDQGGVPVRYVHQKINQGVFRKPAQVMRNFVRVTGHIRNQLENDRVSDVTRRVITLVPTRKDKPYFRD